MKTPFFTQSFPVVLALLLSARIFSAAAAEVNRDALQPALAALPSFEWGQKTDSFDALEKLAVASANDATLRQQLEQGLIKVIQSQATRAAKDYACRQLSLMGGRESALALGPLLTLPELSHMARFALERIPDPAATTILREALPKTTGKLKAGVIHSLGRKADAASVGMLVSALQDPNPDIAAAATLALGSIATPEAVSALAGFISRAPAQLRSAAADGYLKAAQVLTKKGDLASAAAVYARFYPGSEFPNLRLAGLEGLVKTRPDQAPALLREVLGGSNADLRNLASRLVAELPQPITPAPLLDNLASLPSEGQIALLAALTSRKDSTARPAVLSLVKSKTSAVRLAALETLGAIGDANDIPTLARIAATGGRAEQQAARNSLGALPDAGVNEALMAALPVAEPATRAELIRSLGVRSAKEAASVASKYLQDPDARVRQAAIETLGDLRDIQQVPALVKILVSANTPADREAAERAIENLCRKTIGNVTDTLVAGLSRADLEGKAALLRLLAVVGDAKALDAVRQATADPALKDSAIRTLADWPDLTAGKDLLQIAKTAESSLHRTLAFRSYIRLVRDADARPDARLALVAPAADLAKSVDEKRLVIAALSDIMTMQSLNRVAAYLDTPELADEAGAAAVGIAGRVGNLPKGPAGEVLKKVIKSVKSATIRAAAEKQMERLGLK